MKKLLLFATLITILYSCSKEKQEGDVLIRIQNQSGLTALNAKIYSQLPSGGEEVERSYGNINSGQSSDYKSHNIVYPQIFFTLTLSDNSQLENRFKRCDTGIKPLSSGTYSLVIRSDADNKPFVELIKD